MLEEHRRPQTQTKNHTSRIDTHPLEQIMVDLSHQSMIQLSWYAILASAFVLGVTSAFSPARSSSSLSSSNRITNKNLLITGATGGLGKALLEDVLLQSPSLIVLTSRISSLPILEKLKQDIYATNPKIKIVVLPCEMDNLSDVFDFCSSLPDNMPISTVLFSHGVSSRSSFLQTNFEVDEKIMRINFLSVVMITKQIALTLVANTLPGTFCFVSSVQGLIGTPCRSSYAASKFALQGFTESIRAELKSSNIDILTVSPGYINTNLSNSAITGTGVPYGITDPTTANGESPSKISKQIIKHILDPKRKSSDLLVATNIKTRLALWLRFFLPSILEKQLVKRYEKTI